MNIDEQIKKCLTQGQIRVGVHFGVYHAVLLDANTRMAEASSDRGFWHVIAVLVSRVLQDTTLEQDADTAYPRSLSIQTTSDDDRLVIDSFVRMCLIGEVVQIDHYFTGMTSAAAIPGCQNRKASSESFTEALKLLKKASFSPETCVANVL